VPHVGLPVKLVPDLQLDLADQLVINVQTGISFQLHEGILQASNVAIPGTCPVNSDKLSATYAQQ